MPPGHCVDAFVASTEGSAAPRGWLGLGRAKTATEKRFLALGEVAEQFLMGAAAAGVSKLATELEQILVLHAAHGETALLTALERAVEFRRWRADDVRSILAAAGAAPLPRPAGQALVLTLPAVPTRPLSDYAIGGAGHGAPPHPPSRTNSTPGRIGLRWTRLV